MAEERRGVLIHHICFARKEININKLISVNIMLQNAMKGPSMEKYFLLLSTKDKMHGWVTCDFMSFSTVFQSFQNDGQMIMKGSV